MLSHEAEHQLQEDGDPDNCRNGYGEKTVSTDRHQLRIRVPRDRKGKFEPQLVAKHSRRLPNFDNCVISLYSSGMSTREIAEHLGDLYGMDVSPTLVSHVTEKVSERLAEWRSRPLDRCYALVSMDAIRVKIRGEDGMVANKAVHVAVGINLCGHKELLGMWIFKEEGASNWMRFLNDLKARGVDRILVMSVDGLKGLPEAIAAAFPKTVVQTCIVHLLRHSLNYASLKDRKRLAAMLKRIYQSVDADEAERRLRQFENSDEGRKYPMIGKSWRSHWDRVIPFLAFSPVLRKMMYTTNAIESVNSLIRKSVRRQGHFPSDQAALKAIFLGLQPLLRKWNKAKAVPGWHDAKIEFAIMFGDDFQTAC